VGHAGTLDPIATGLLPIAFGEATKTIPFLVEGLKTYKFVVRWGEARDTDDAEGTVIGHSDKRPTKCEIRSALAGFCGEIFQRPPKYSAIKVNGKRAYQLARENLPLILKERLVRVERLDLLDVLSRDTAVFELQCGKGVYVRSIARDLGKTLGTEGHVVELRRMRVGSFDVRAAISLAQLEELKDIRGLAGRLLPLAEGLAGVPVVCVDPEQALRLRHGQSVALVTAPKDCGERVEAPALLCAVLAKRPVALVDFSGGEIRPRRVFNYGA
jgi:tRNA pseudouridine55 synthase